jgi:hypothetical protein
MLYRKFINIWLILLTIAAVALLIGSCSSGTPPVGPDVINRPPKIEIVNIPPDNSHFTTNPQIYWFGTDVDGKIVSYEYAVVPAALLVASQVDTSSDTLIMAYAAANISRPSAGKDCKPESCWQQIDVATADNPNKQTIRLFADKDPSISIMQYFFVRAIDNDSGRSNIDYRLYSRTNHPPETVIKTVPDAAGYYDLNDTSTTYKGIYFEWKGTDKIDYPDDNQNPTFEYFYQVFGPYQKDEIFGPDSTGNYAFDYRKVDTNTTIQPNKLVLQSHDSLSANNVWVTKVSARIFGVWKNQPPSDTTRSGYFVLKVTARDDAFVSDTLPAYISFFTIDAHFENKLLVYVPFFCANSAQLGDIPCGPTVDSMSAFYKRVISAAGYDSSKVIITTDPAGFVERPSKLELAKYKVYLMIDDGNFSHLIDTNYMDVTPYLDMGGNVWVWGLSPFGCYYNASAAKMQSLAQRPIPLQYFDVVGEFYGGWGESYKNRWIAWNGNPPRLIPTNEEFLGGLAEGARGMPSFDVDSAKYSSIYIAFPEPPAEWRAAPNTNYFVRSAFSEPLWLFKSYFGDSYLIPDSMEAYVAGLQGKVIGLRYDSRVFKTSVYGFSLYLLHEEQADSIFAQSMRWFLQPR